MLNCVFGYDLKVLLYYYCKGALTLSRSRDKRILLSVYCRFCSVSFIVQLFFFETYLLVRFWKWLKTLFRGKEEFSLFLKLFLRPFDWMALKRSASKTEETSQFRIHVQIVSSIPCMKEMKTKKIKNSNSLKQVYLLFLHHSKGQDSFLNAMK